MSSTNSPLNPVQVGSSNSMQSSSIPTNPIVGAGPKGFLMKKLAANSGQSFYSPTDNMMSPCTQKLVQQKKKHYTKGKPLTLSGAFQQSANPIKSSLGTSVQSQENVKPKMME